jgi:putative solute:sodium symporter small subunit
MAQVTRPEPGRVPVATTGVSEQVREAHWRKTSRLMWTIMALWFVFSFLVHMFARPLNEIVILGFPLGFYMAAQGSLIAFVVLCFWNAAAQDRIDREFGVAEED